MTGRDQVINQIRQVAGRFSLEGLESWWRKLPVDVEPGAQKFCKDMLPFNVLPPNLEQRIVKENVSVSYELYRLIEEHKAVDQSNEARASGDQQS